MRTLERRYYRTGVGNSMNKGSEAGKLRHIWGMAGNCIVVLLCGFWGDYGGESKRREKIRGSTHSYPGVASVPQAQVPFHIPHLGSGWAFTYFPVPESQSWGNPPFPRSSSEGHEEGAAFLSFLASGHRDLPAETLRSAVHPLGCLVSLCLVSRSVPLVTTSQARLKSCMMAAVSLCNSHPTVSPCPCHFAKSHGQGPPLSFLVREAHRCPWRDQKTLGQCPPSGCRDSRLHPATEPWAAASTEKACLFFMKGHSRPVPPGCCFGPWQVRAGRYLRNHRVSSLGMKTEAQSREVSHVESGRASVMKLKPAQFPRQPHPKLVQG